MMSQNWRLLVLFLIIPALSGAHPLHLSFTNLEYKEGRSAWELTVKVFTDDFQNSLELATNFNGSIPKSSKSADLGRIILQWLGPSLSIQFDDREIAPSAWKFEGLKIQKDAVIISLSFQSDPPLRSVKVRNTIHFELFADQKNLFIFTLGRFQSANHFKRNDPEKLISLAR
ncbi:MAG: DUF6702 family protein [Bacteroidales bacterium]